MNFHFEKVKIMDQTNFLLYYLHHITHFVNSLFNIIIIIIPLYYIINLLLS